MLEQITSIVSPAPVLKYVNFRIYFRHWAMSLFTTEIPNWFAALTQVLYYLHQKVDSMNICLYWLHDFSPAPRPIFKYVHWHTVLYYCFELSASWVNNRKDLAGLKARLTLVECFPVERRGSGARYFQHLTELAPSDVPMNPSKSSIVTLP